MWWLALLAFSAWCFWRWGQRRREQRIVRRIHADQLAFYQALTGARRLELDVTLHIDGLPVAEKGKG